MLSAFPALHSADALQEADKAAGDWLKFQVETARIESEWRSESKRLESLVAALQERATSLEEKRDLTKAKTAQDREEIDAVRAKNDAAAADLKTCEARLKTLTTNLLALRPRLPPHLSDALEMSYRTLAAPNVALNDRMQVAANVLNRCAQFNRIVSVSEDELALNGGNQRSLEVIYWGLSHAYALDRAAHTAWVGSPGRERWQWEARPEAFDAVAALIAIAHDKDEPRFIAVPAVIAHSATEAVRN